MGSEEETDSDKSDNLERFILGHNRAVAWWARALEQGKELRNCLQESQHDVS